MGRHGQIGIGERAVDFVAAGSSASPERFYAYAGGRATVIVFDDGAVDQTLSLLAARLDGRADVALHRVTTSQPGEATAFRAWVDPDRAVAGAYGIDPSTVTTVVVDPNLRVVGVASGANLVADTVALLDRAGYPDEPVEIRGQAPVLFVPRVLDATQRHELIRVWHGEWTPTGVARSTGDTLDAGMKRRGDHVVHDPDLLRRLTSGIGRRLFPEVRKAFAFRPTRFEGFKIACYDASTGGFFRAHRDNLTPATAHRVFALTLNLNDDYVGGQLGFPEYGSHFYRPDAGTALVFACAHLHEVLDVTEGQRFVLISFLSAER